MIEFPYDDGYSPPAPVCQVVFESARTGQSVGPLDAILDTGADGTLVPQNYLIDLLVNRRTTVGFFPWRFVDSESSIGRCVAIVDDDEYEELTGRKQECPRPSLGMRMTRRMWRAFRD